MTVAHETGAPGHTSNPTPVSVIGLGMMGRALAQTFLVAGHTTTVWNRSSGKDDALVEEGAIRAATITEAVAASPLVVICVTTHAAVLDALTPAGDALAGRAVVNLTSGTPEQAQELSAWVMKHGGEYLDGTIMAIPHEMGQADTLLFYSGSAAVYERHQHDLRVLGGRSTYLGAVVGLAAVYDLALLSGMYTLLGGFLHGVALAGTSGIKAEAITPYITGTLTTVISWLADIAREIDDGAYETEISSLDINKDGVALIRQASEARGISAEVLAPIQAMINRRVDAGYGRQGLASLIEELRRSTPAA